LPADPSHTGVVKIVKFLHSKKSGGLFCPPP
jgi:hypothetical protein